MDFIKSLRSFTPLTNNNRMNSSRMNSTRINENPVTTSRPPLRKQESFKDRFSEKSKCPTARGPSSSEKIRQQKEEARRNQRLNKLTSHRIKNTIPSTSTPFIRSSTSNNASECEASITEADLSSTFIMAENLSPRKLRLAMWRKEKDAAAKKAKVANARPAWRATNVDPRILENKSKIGKAYSFQGHSRGNTSTNTSSHRQNSTLLKKPPTKKEVQYFGSSIDTSSSKFTFAASVETFPEFIKRRESSPIKPDLKPVKKVTAKITQEFKDIMDGLSAEDRAFLNETMEVRNDILKKSKLASPTSTHEDEEDKNEIKLKTPKETLKETAKEPKIIQETPIAPVVTMNPKTIELPKLVSEVTTPKQSIKTDETVIITNTTKDVAKSIETITQKMNQTLTIDADEIKPTEITKIISVADETKPNSEVLKMKIQPEPVAVVEKIATPAKTIFITERPTSPVLVITEKVIISPIQTPLASKIDNNANDNTSESVKYFRNLIVDKTKLLEDLANIWEALVNKVQEPVISDENQGDIRCACGLAKLLIEERFSQFKELIDKCEDSNSSNHCQELESKLVLASDLQGFWDMINHQIIDVEKRFFNLAKLKGNNWVEIIEAPPVRKADAKPFKAKINPMRKKNGDKEEIIEKPKPKAPAKSKFAEFRKKMMQKKQNEDEEIITNKDDKVINTVEPIQPEITNVKQQENKKEKVDTIASIKPVESEKPSKTKVRRSIKPEINLENIIASTSVKDGYSLRTRRSNNLMSFSPAKSNTPKRAVAKGIFTLPNCNSTIVEGNEAETSSVHKREPSLCYEFDESFTSITFGKTKTNKNNETVLKSTKPEASLPSVPVLSNININMNSPKTPQCMRQRELHCNSAEISKSNPQFLKNISNSPLLKLAMISSHGKRQSLSTGKNLKSKFSNDTENKILDF